MDPIDAYLVELAAALRGPSRLKADLLQEARDSLVDARDAEITRGAVPAVAAQRAIVDFGTPRRVAPGFQTELDLAQARRAAWLLLVGIAVQPVVWDVLWPLVGHGQAVASGRLLVVEELVRWAGTAAFVAAAVGLLATSIGQRWAVLRPKVVPLTGTLALAAAATISALGVVMAVMYSTTGLDSAPLIWVCGFVVVPMSVVGRSARRCLARP